MKWISQWIKKMKWISQWIKIPSLQNPIKLIHFIISFRILLLVVSHLQVQGSVAEVERLSTLVVELRDGRRRLGTGGFLDDESMNLWISKISSTKTYMFFNYFMFFLKKSSHIIGFMKVKHTVFFNGRNTEASEWMRTRPWNGALIEAEAVRFKNLWTCDILTRQGLWENVRSKHGNEMRRKWRQHLDLMEQNSKILEVFFSVSHRFWLMLKEFVEDDAFYIHLKRFFWLFRY